MHSIHAKAGYFGIIYDFFFICLNAPLRDFSETTGGEKSYLIPLGGTDKMGVFGYIEEYNELLSGGVIDHVTDIVVACGSGGTIAGLAIANYLSGNSDKVRYDSKIVISKTYFWFRIEERYMNIYESYELKCYY